MHMHRAFFIFKILHCSFGRLARKLSCESRARKTKNEYEERDLQARRTLRKSISSGGSIPTIAQKIAKFSKLNCFHDCSSKKYTWPYNWLKFLFCFRHRLLYAQFLQLFSAESASTLHFRPLKIRCETKVAFPKILANDLFELLLIRQAQTSCCAH